MNTKKSAKVIAVGMAALALALTSCDANQEFKDSCKEVGGEVKRENEAHSFLGMAPVGYVSRPGPGGRGSARSGKSSKNGGNKKSLNKKRNFQAPVPNATATDSSGINLGGSSSGKKSSKKSGDNDWVCVKNGEILFED